MAYAPPTFDGSAFNCPNCGAYSEQKFGQGWGQVMLGTLSRGTFQAVGIDFSKCAHCGQVAVWSNQKLVLPETSTIPPPNPDCPTDVRDDYEEARAILSRSPRGAAALLRLGLQKLCKELGEKGKNIDEDISSLVSKGLPSTLQQAMDTLRVVGNESVHPGLLDVRDDATLASGLFTLINLVVDRLISEPKRIAEMYGKLPLGKREGIDKRDGRSLAS